MQQRQRQLLKSCTKAQFYVENINNIESIFYDAIRTAISGRPGPVYISIPPELQNDEVIISEVLSEDRFSGREYLH
jgi:thiamine pyrophosphate-dependent acetolactate synthase large subunit-like protein